MKLSVLLGTAFLGLLCIASAARAQGEKQPAKPEPEKPAASQPAPKTEKTVYVLMQTSLGDITLELNREKAPISTDNFLAYADKNFYDGTIFHRVMDFMVQGGGFTPDLGQKKTEKPIKNEWQNGLKNKKYTVAMARIGGQGDSATSQFFINLKDNPYLDENRDRGGGYAVFGQVVEGMSVVDSIGKVKTGAKATPSGQVMQDVPVDTVTITKVRRLTTQEAEKLKERLGKK